MITLTLTGRLDEKKMKLTRGMIGTKASLSAHLPWNYCLCAEKWSKMGNLSRTNGKRKRIFTGQQFPLNSLTKKLKKSSDIWSIGTRNKVKRTKTPIQTRSNTTKCWMKLGITAGKLIVSKTTWFKVISIFLLWFKCFLIDWLPFVTCSSVFHIVVLQLNNVLYYCL